MLFRSGCAVVEEVALSKPRAISNKDLTMIRLLQPVGSPGALRCLLAGRSRTPSYVPPRSLGLVSSRPVCFRNVAEGSAPASRAGILPGPLKD